MTDLITRMEQVLHHSRRFYLRLCAFCNRPVGAGRACAHGRELLAQARSRSRSLLRHAPTGDAPQLGPWLARPVIEVGLAWPESSQIVIQAARPARAG